MNNTNFIEKYREFVNKLSTHGNCENLNTDLTDDAIMNIGNTFVTEINTSRKLQKYLSAKNTKFFNTNKKKNVKIDIHPHISIKQLIKKNEQIENVVWNYLQMFYVILEVNNTNSKTASNTKPFVNQLIKQLQDTIVSTPQDQRSNMDDMIFDIAETFKSISMESKNTADAASTEQHPNTNTNSTASGQPPTGGLGNMFGGNTIENILKTSQVIAQKYQTKIESGDMSMEDMISSLSKMLPANDSQEGSSDLIDNIFSRQDVEKEKLDEMKEFYTNENITISKEDITNVSNQLNSKIGEISSSMGECMDGSQDISKLLSGITQLTNMGS